MSPSSPSPPQTLHSPPITIVLTVILLVFFLLGFFSIYFCRCIVEAVFHTWHFRRSPSGRRHHLPSTAAGGINPSHTGLDRALIKSLPTFLYSSVKEVRKHKYALECAICLVEFNADSLLRLLTSCYHVFHQECIDHWLNSHKTCPVCRRDLDSPHLFPAKSPPPPPPPPPPPEASVRIDVDYDEEEEAGMLEEMRRRLREGRRLCMEKSWRRSVDAGVKEGEGMAAAGERFTRSHSTGHSIAKRREDFEEEDRYTLRLPEHVRMRILRARHWAASCEEYKWDQYLVGHRFHVSSDYGSTVSDNDSGALLAATADHQSHVIDHRTV